MEKNSVNQIEWGPHLKSLRQYHNLTQQAVADILHIKRQVYQRIESGEQPPKPEFIAVLSNIYDTDLFFFALHRLPAEYVEEQRVFKLNLNSAIQKPAEPDNRLRRNKTRKHNL